MSPSATTVLVLMLAIVASIPLLISYFVPGVKVRNFGLGSVWGIQIGSAVKIHRVAMRIHRRRLAVLVEGLEVAVKNPPRPPRPGSPEPAKRDSRLKRWLAHDASVHSLHFLIRTVFNCLAVEVHWALAMEEAVVVGGLLTVQGSSEESKLRLDVALKGLYAAGMTRSGTAGETFLDVHDDLTLSAVFEAKKGSLSVTTTERKGISVQYHAMCEALDQSKENHHQAMAREMALFRRAGRLPGEGEDAEKGAEGSGAGNRDTRTSDRSCAETDGGIASSKEAPPPSEAAGSDATPGNATPKGSPPPPWMPPPPPARLSPLTSIAAYFLTQIEIDVPRLIASVAVSDRIALKFTLQRSRLLLENNDSAPVPSDHIIYLGRDRRLGLSINAFIQSFSIDIHTKAQTSVKTILFLAETGLCLSSLLNVFDILKGRDRLARPPPAIAALLEQNDIDIDARIAEQASTLPRHSPDNTIIVHGKIGYIDGHLPWEVIENLHHFRVERSRNHRSHKNQRGPPPEKAGLGEQETDSNGIPTVEFSDPAPVTQNLFLPRIVCHIDIEGGKIILSNSTLEKPEHSRMYVAALSMNPSYVHLEGDYIDRFDEYDSEFDSYAFHSSSRLGSVDTYFFDPDSAERFYVLTFGPVGWESGHVYNLRSPGKSVNEVNLHITQIQLDLWRPWVLERIVRAFRNLIENDKYEEPSNERDTSEDAASSLEKSKIPFNFFIAIADTDFRVSGVDSVHTKSPLSRGVALHCDLTRLQLQRGCPKTNISKRSNRDWMRQNSTKAASPVGSESPNTIQFSGLVSNLRVDPVFDAESSQGHTHKDTSTKWFEFNKHHNGVFSDWEHNRAFEKSPEEEELRNEKASGTTSYSLLQVPEFDLVCSTSKNCPLNVAINTGPISFRPNPINLYLCMIAVNTFQKVVRAGKKPSAVPEPRASRPKKKKELNINLTAVAFRVYLTLPHDVEIFMAFKTMTGHFTRERINFTFDMALAAGQYPADNELWEDMIWIRTGSIDVVKKPENSGAADYVISVNAAAGRLFIPFRYIFSEVIDNTVNFVKITKQFINWYIKENDVLVRPVPEKSKRIPEINISFGVLTFEFQDDPFENRLNIIWRAGSEEQTDRLEREKAFFARVEKEKKGEVKSLVSFEDASRNLQQFNGTRWIKRIKNAISEQARREESVIRHTYNVSKGLYELPKRSKVRQLDFVPISFAPLGKLTPLMRTVFKGVSLKLGSPSFGLDDASMEDFLHDKGRGIPRDTVYTLLFPFHITWLMDEARIHLRDYPLPLLHIPPMPILTTSTHKSWELASDLVICERMPLTDDSVRFVPILILEDEKTETGQSSGSFVVTARRSGMPVKTIFNPYIKINTPYSTRLVWGNSLSPAISDLTRAVDALTRPSSDPSEKIGFWDKIRLQLLWSVTIDWAGEGDVHLILKGSRDPYVLIGTGSGFVKAWRGNVKFLIGQPNPDHEFFQIVSDEYILGTPNLRSYFDSAASGVVSSNASTSHVYDADGSIVNQGTQSASHSHISSFEEEPEFAPTHEDYMARYNLTGDPDFLTIDAKFINGVKWGLGAKFERTCLPDCQKPECKGKKETYQRQCRFFDFKPHYEVVTRVANGNEDQKKIDSFAGFRSDFIHFSLSLTSPLRDPGYTPRKTCDPPAQHGQDQNFIAYNSLHVSSLRMQHFMAWWRLFDGKMSLPIRRGALFPSLTPPSKKFGKHCATIKYRFSLAPLYISYTAIPEVTVDWIKGVTKCHVIKGRIDAFNVDLHQRAQEKVISHPGTGITKKVVHKAFHRAEVDIDTLDMRLLTALFDEPLKKNVDLSMYDFFYSKKERKEALKAADDDEGFTDPLLDEEEDDEPLGGWSDTRKQTHPSRLADVSDLNKDDIAWIDWDDFTDVTYRPINRDAKLRVLPLLKTQRFTYFRKVERNSANETEYSKFGYEGTHTCVMGNALDTFSLQLHFFNERLAELETLKASKTNSDARIEEVTCHIESIRKLISKLKASMKGTADAGTRDAAYGSAAPMAEPSLDVTPESSEELLGELSRTLSQAQILLDSASPTVSRITSLEAPPLAPAPSSGSAPCDVSELLENWDNRYMIHNPKLRISSTTRTVLQQIYYAIQDRRGLVFNMSAGALKLIRRLSKEHRRMQMKAYDQRNGVDTGSDDTEHSHILGDKLKVPHLPHPNLPNLTNLPNLPKTHTRKRDGTASEPASPLTPSTPTIPEFTKPAPKPKRHESAYKSEYEFCSSLDCDADSFVKDMPDHFRIEPGHLVIMLKPQVALESTVVDKRSTLYLTALRAQIKTFDVRDSRIPENLINSKVLHQTFAAIDGMQIFHPRLDDAGRCIRSSLDGFVPIETLLDSRIEPWGFDLIVPQTSATLRYDKFNHLRLDSVNAMTGGVHGHGRAQGHAHRHEPGQNGHGNEPGHTPSPLSHAPAHSAAGAPASPATPRAPSSTWGQASPSPSATPTAPDTPEAKESHFITGTDRLSINCPKFSVSADPHQFDTIYSVVTDLVLYTDPLHKIKSKKIDDLAFTNDFSDLYATARAVISLQDRNRIARELIDYYMLHFEELDEIGLQELYFLRADFMKISTELGVVFLALSRSNALTGSKSKAKDKKAKANLQFDARAQELVWHMLDKSSNPFTKLTINGADYTFVGDEEGRKTNSLTIKDMKALNCQPEHLFTEIFAKFDPSEVPSGKKKMLPALAKFDAIVSARWSTLPPVGGIPIFSDFSIRMHPVKIQLEHHVGKQIVEYMFAQKSKGKDEMRDESSSESDASSSDDAASELSVADTRHKRRSKFSLSSRTSGTSGGAPRKRRNSLLAVAEHARDDASSLGTDANGSSNMLTVQPVTRIYYHDANLKEQYPEDGLDADEMRRRASKNKTFLLFNFDSTFVSLSHHSNHEDHSSLPDVYNISFKAPAIEYQNQILSFADLADDLKKDLIKAVWSQKGALLGQLMQRSHRRMPAPERKMLERTKSISANSQHSGSSSPGLLKRSLHKLQHRTSK